MDKYEFKLKVDEMKALVSARNYNAAAEIAETINWRKIRNLNALVLAGEIFEQVGQFEHSKEILLMAYDKSPIGRNIIYRLAEIAIKTHNFDDAREYYDEFVDIAPHDNLKYVLKYKMMAAQGFPFEDQIKILEELKEQEYSEEWAYELALLYHKAGQPDKCVDACDELELWFGDGIYVEKALELKIHYQPLSEKQKEKYRLFRQKRAGVIEVKPNDKKLAEAAEASGSSDTADTSDAENKIHDHTTGSAKKTDDAVTADKIYKDHVSETEERSDTAGTADTSHSDDHSAKLPDDEPESIQDVQINPESGKQQKLPYFSLSKYRKKQKHPYVPVQEDVPVSESRKSIGELMNQWEKTEQAAQEALRQADPENLTLAKEEILKEAENLMERLLDVMPQLSSDADGLQDVNSSEEMENGALQNDIDQAARIVAGINQLLQEQINSLLAESQIAWPPAGMEQLERGVAKIYGMSGAAKGYQDDAPVEAYAGNRTETSQELRTDTEQESLKEPYAGIGQEYIKNPYINTESKFQDDTYMDYYTEQKFPVESHRNAVQEFQNVSYANAGQSEEVSEMETEQKIQREVQGMDPGQKMQEQPVVMETGIQRVKQAMLAGARRTEQENADETENQTMIQQQEADTGSVVQKHETGIEAASQQKAAKTEIQNETGVQAASRQKAAVKTEIQNETGMEAVSRQKAAAVKADIQNETGMEAVSRQKAAVKTEIQNETDIESEPAWNDRKQAQEIPVMPTGIERVRQAMLAGARSVQQKAHNTKTASGHGKGSRQNIDTIQINNQQENIELQVGEKPGQPVLQTNIQQDQANVQLEHNKNQKMTAAGQQSYNDLQEMTAVGQDQEIPTETTSMNQDDKILNKSTLAEQRSEIETEAAVMEKDDRMRRQIYPEQQNNVIQRKSHFGQQENEKFQEAYPQQGYEQRPEAYPQQRYEQHPEAYPEGYEQHQKTDTGQQGYEQRPEAYLKQREYERRPEMYSGQQGYEQRPATDFGQQGYEQHSATDFGQQGYDMYRESLHMQTADSQKKSEMYADAGRQNEESDIGLERYGVQQKDLDQGQEKYKKRIQEFPTQAEHQDTSVMDEQKGASLKKVPETRTSKSHKDDPGIRQLTPERKEVFSYFVPISGMEAQIYDLLEGVSNHLQFEKDSITGNFIVEGIKGSGKTVLITDIIKVLQKELKRPNGKIGRIDANVLNQKDLNALTEKVSGGCLIIESAGKISRETAVKLSRCMDMDRSGTLYILEDTEQGIQKALDRDSSFSAKFTEKITIPSFSIDELAEFGRAYANDLNYDIDDMGILALYKRINNIQKLNHVTTLTEVKEIVDEAIDNAEKGALKKVLGILTSTRYNDDNYVILREKDFE